MRFEAGEYFGRYEIVEAIGAGAMGEIYRARDGRLGRDVAVKTLATPTAGRADALQRLHDEARAIAALAHPNILAIFDFGSEGETAYAVTELLEGETLESALAGAGGPLSIRRTVEVATAVCEGLAAAHRKGILHRDLKPANVFLTRDGQVKILDFGLAQPLSTAEVDDEAATCAPDEALLVGTPAYMAPEQVRGEPLTPACDLFALGCILFECFTGRRPFGGATLGELLAAILRDEPDLAAQRAIPESVKAIVLHCLEKNPERRFQSARDVAFALHSALSQVEVRSSDWPGAAATPTICVLPLACRGDDLDADFLSEGVAESVINLLSRLPQVKVIARTTAFRFRDSPLSPAGVAAELGAAWVLSGKITPHRGRLVVQVELVDGRSGAQAWGRRYLREADDVFGLQEEIAREIASELSLELTSEQDAALASRPTRSALAYELYLRGRFQWDRRSRASVEAAVRLFNQAIGEDPGFALAYSGLADAYNVMSYHGWGAPERFADLSLAAARKAVELAPELPEALVSLGGGIGTFEWRRREAASLIERALLRQPSYASGRHWLSHDLLCIGDLEGALAQAKLAVQLDPLGKAVQRWLAEVHYYRHELPQAIEACRRLLDLDPDLGFSHGLLGTMLVVAGEAEAGHRELEQTLQLEDSPRVRALLAHAEASLGRSAEAREQLRTLEASEARDAIPYDLALAWAGLGDLERVLTHLHAALAARYERVIHSRFDLKLDQFRGEPRFAAFLGELDRAVK